MSVISSSSSHAVIWLLCLVAVGQCIEDFLRLKDNQKTTSASPVRSTAHKPLSPVLVTSKPLLFLPDNPGTTYTDNNGLVRSWRSKSATTTELPTSSSKSQEARQSWKSKRQPVRFRCVSDEDCMLTGDKPVRKALDVESELRARSAWSPLAYYGNSHNDNDPWPELVGMKLPAVPIRHRVTPPTVTSISPTVTPVRNIVRLPTTRPRPKPAANISNFLLHHFYRPATSRPSTTPLTTQRATTAFRPSRSTLGTALTPLTTEIPSSDALTSAETHPATVQHVVVFKMLLLIAFVAVPILAAAVPFLSPSATSRSSRGRRDDDALVDWASDTATFLAMAHLIADGRLGKLLQLGDDEFVDTVSTAVADDNHDKVAPLRQTMAALLEAVRDHSKKRFPGGRELKTNDILDESEEDLPFLEK